jgi:hypothetical protein
MHDGHRPWRHSPADQVCNSAKSSSAVSAPACTVLPCHPRDLRGGPDGRPHAGICWQTSRRVRSRWRCSHPGAAVDVSGMDRCCRCYPTVA